MKVEMKKIILCNIFWILSSAIFAKNDFACSKMDNKRSIDIGAVYGVFYALGYNDASNKKIDNELDEILNKLVEYIKVGCEKNPNSNIINLFRKGIQSGFVKSDFTKKKFEQNFFDVILYKLSGGADIDTRECLKINLTEDLVQIIESKFYKLENVCGKSCKRYKRKDLRNIFNKSEGIKFDKEFKLAFKKCKL